MEFLIVNNQTESRFKTRSLREAGFWASLHQPSKFGELEVYSAVELPSCRIVKSPSLIPLVAAEPQESDE